MFPSTVSTLSLSATTVPFQIAFAIDINTLKRSQTLPHYQMQGGYVPIPYPALLRFCLVNYFLAVAAAALRKAATFVAARSTLALAAGDSSTTCPTLERNPGIFCRISGSSGRNLA